MVRAGLEDLLRTERADYTEQTGRSLVPPVWWLARGPSLVSSWKE
jgi:hypothetical protein